MKINKLLKKIKSFLSGKARKRKAKKKRLTGILKMLKMHEKALKKQLDEESNKAIRSALDKEITLTRAHRKKGLKNLKALGKE
jgi:hypothetical protein